MTEEFPSPTGVNYYESIICQIGASVLLECFRPQQGLTIMNKAVVDVCVDA